MRDLSIRLTKDNEELKEVLKIRETVFVKGQKVPKTREIDGLDKNAKHAIVFYKNKCVGCARIRFIENKAKLERIAIIESYRKKGLGKLLMTYLINYCKRKKMSKIILHSQYYVRDFYARCGFKQKGRLFRDANISHVKMELRL